MAEKLPPPDPRKIAATRPDVFILSKGAVLWRIYDSAGPYATAWNRMRYVGPTSSRFDHHTRCSGTMRWKSQKFGILYAAEDSPASFAGVFQQGRTIEVSGSRRRRLVAFVVEHDLPILDLTGSWPVRAGGNAAIHSGSHVVARAWSRVIYKRHPGIKGLLSRSSLDASLTCLTLYERAAAALPAAPASDRSLDDPAVFPIIEAAAVRFGYDIGRP